ncbi:hypothetical protein Sa4125_21530 [Aureimonas sp. SA4125]|uniref:DUF6894 family protein n=1 Tax=Aureimonas sp. SA4125 TaxID=2826993 RepID=UPI001CC33EDA|nr:hypothetical protein [Aureimonas sp. SA4125]BDA84611.1 hypothetical protein Sa4125_21530 [Aureimonas sp. SA4125]
MQQFFFNTRSGGVLVRDYAGHTLAHLDEAISQAREMALNMRYAEKLGKNIGARQIEICDDEGRTVKIVAVKHVADKGDAS